MALTNQPQWSMTTSKTASFYNKLKACAIQRMVPTVKSSRKFDEIGRLMIKLGRETNSE